MVRKIPIQPNAIEYKLGGPDGEYVSIEIEYTDQDGLRWKLTGSAFKIQLID